MTDTAWTIAIAYAAVTLVGVTIALIVLRSTRVGFRVRVAGRETLEKRENFWGVAVVTFLVIVLAGTMFSLPYWTGNDAEAAQKVDVTGRQFAWTVDPPQIQAGVETEFIVHAEDVSHAIGLYDPDGTLLQQVNVLPGVTQSMRITLEDPGTYEIRCLEYCGLDHHLMENKLEVKP